MHLRGLSVFYENGLKLLEDSHPGGFVNTQSPKELHVI